MNVITQKNSFVPQNQGVPHISALRSSASLLETMPAIIYSAHPWPPMDSIGIPQEHVWTGAICRSCHMTMGKNTSYALTHGWIVFIREGYFQYRNAYALHLM